MREQEKKRVLAANRQAHVETEDLPWAKKFCPSVSRANYSTASGGRSRSTFPPRSANPRTPATA